MESAWPRTPTLLACTPFVVHEGCSLSRGSTGSRVQGAGKRARLQAGWAEPESPGESALIGEERGVSLPCKLVAADSGLGVEGGRWPLEAGFAVPLHAWHGRCHSNQWSEQKISYGSDGYWRAIGQRGFLKTSTSQLCKVKLLIYWKAYERWQHFA